MFASKLLYQLTYDRRWPTKAIFLDNARQVAAANQDGDIVIWNLPEKVPTMADGAKGAGGIGDAKREAPDLAPAFSLVGHTNEIVGLEYDPAKKLIYSASWDRTIKIWSIAEKPSGTGEIVLDRGKREEKARRSKDKADPPTTGGSPVGTYQPIATLEGHTGRIRSMAISQDGSLLATGDSNSEVIVWDLAKRTILKRWSGFDWNQIVGLAISPDNKSVAVCEYRYKRDNFDMPAPAFRVFNLDGTVKLDILKILVPKYEPNKTSYEGAQAWRRVICEGLISLRYSRDGKYLAAAQGGEQSGCKALLIDAATGKQAKELAKHENGVNDVLFTRDDKYLFSSGRDTTVRVSEIASGKEVAAMGKSRGGQFKDWISSVALSPDEKFLVCADIGGVVNVWEITR